MFYRVLNTPMIITKNIETERKKQNRNIFHFYLPFPKQDCHFIRMAVKMRRNSSCSTQIYLFPVIEKNTLVGITLFWIIKS